MLKTRPNKESCFQKRQGYDLYNYRIYELVPEGSRVLDVGCATGKLLEALEKNKGCRTFGIESVNAMAREAAKRCKNIVTSDIESPGDLPFEKNSFDCIVFADVLEHLKRPDEVLKKMREYLKSEGSLLVSCPNVAFISVRLSLLFGNFNYTEYGLLDKSHLRFFTAKSARSLIEQAGYALLGFEGYNQVRLRFCFIKPLGKIWKNLFATDFIITARKKD